ncbi:MAG: hypothetical protein J6Q18_00795, partial [Oscillospiraceae bacterium]|nr:hypothetical protein [Oscillospiraceae bacterium]
NEEISIPASEIVGYNNFEYTYGDNKKKVKTEVPPVVILNNEEYTGTYTQAVMWPTAGSVTLVDNDKDGVYDIVFIMAYEDYYVKSLIKSEYKVVSVYTPDKDGDGQEDMLVLNPGTDDITIIDAAGNKLDFDALQTGDVITVAEANSKITVYISKETVTGNITQTYSQYGDEVWKIADGDYT